MKTRPVSVVVLAKYKEIFLPFYESYMKYDPQYPMIVVRDGDEVPDPNTLGGILLPVDRKVVQGPEKFAMAGNGNLGLKAAPAGHDILYCGDDVRFIQPDTIEKLQEAAYKDESIGILSPRIIGRGSPTQVNPQLEISYCRPLEMWFPCVYIKRELIDKIGYLDERFNNFGSDDLDYCIRTLLAGYKLAVTSSVAVKHEASPEGGPTTFVKKLGFDEYMKQQDAAFEKLREKYDLTVERLNKFLRTGDLALLEKEKEVVKVAGDKLVAPFSRPSRPSNDEVNDFLRTRSLYIATPAYGGWLSVTYVQSLLGVAKLCREIGMDHTVSFMYNESLITRARNKMVSDYLRTSDFTDFFFIDADISFDPRDLVRMVMYDEEIIGCPCVRKNLRLDRIEHAVITNQMSYLEKLCSGEYANQPSKELFNHLKSNGFSNNHYTIDQLKKLCGEFVINFPPDAEPGTMKLSELAEVQDVGTGLVKIKREVFEKFKNFHPGRDYLPMRGEDDDAGLPMYMYFQASIDEDSAKYHTSNIPHYVPEDYAFCRDARRAGMKIHIAPWMKTGHFGSYVFEGDIESVAVAGGTLR